MSDLLSLSEEQRFRLLVSAVTDYAIYMLDPEGRIATWNAGRAAVQGLCRRRDHRPAFLALLHAERTGAAGLPRARAADGGSRRAGTRPRAGGVRKDGTRFWVNVVIDPIIDETGQLIGFAKITRDITDKKRAEEELEADSRRLVPVAEAAGARRAHRRRRPRFQQSDDGRCRLEPIAAEAPDLPPRQARRYLRRDRRDRRAGDRR